MRLYIASGQMEAIDGGPAYAAGIGPGDLLLECGGREIRPPEDLHFSLAESANLLVEKLHGGQRSVRVQLPMPKPQKPRLLRRTGCRPRG
jgi:hypothetical protein